MSTPPASNPTLHKELSDRGKQILRDVVDGITFGSHRGPKHGQVKGHKDKRATKGRIRLTQCKGRKDIQHEVSGGQVVRPSERIWKPTATTVSVSLREGKKRTRGNAAQARAMNLLAQRDWERVLRTETQTRQEETQTRQKSTPKRSVARRKGRQLAAMNRLTQREG